jgi:hypothetical protein
MKNNMKQKPKPIKSVDVPLAPAHAVVETSAKITLTLGTREVPNSDVKDYNHAAAQEKAWKIIKDDKKPLVEAPALTRLYDHNTLNPFEPVKTVCVVDSSGAACNVTLKDTYGAAAHDPERVTAGLAGLGQVDPNKFVAEKIVVGFNTSVFYDDKGVFRKALYIAMMEAVDDVALTHGVQSPFSSTKVVTVKDGFAEERWKVFTEAQQPAVSKLFPATVSLTPLAPTKKPKE